MPRSTGNGSLNTAAASAVVHSTRGQCRLTVEVLMKRGANADNRHPRGLSALDHARQGRRPSVGDMIKYELALREKAEIEAPTRQPIENPETQPDSKGWL